jgi:hypothetical protein
VARDGERLPDGFSFEDFMSAVRSADADRAAAARAPDALTPDDADLPTDDDGCVELATIPAADLPAFLARLREAGFTPHIEMPGDEPFATATAAVFVPWPRLAEARRLMGLEA